MLAGSDVTSSYAEIAGGPGRWTLTPIETGLGNMAEMYSTVNQLANEMTLYNTLQGITMQLLILRLIRVLSAQKRLSILTSTAIKVGCLSSPSESPMKVPYIHTCRYKMEGFAYCQAWLPRQ